MRLNLNTHNARKKGPSWSWFIDSAMGPVAFLGLILLGFILLILGIKALDDLRSDLTLSECRDPDFIQAVGTRYETRYIYRCGGGRLINVSKIWQGKGH